MDGSHIGNYLVNNVNMAILPVVSNSRSRIGSLFRDQREKPKIPYIFICPTLYQENEDEMKTLLISILRLNRYRIKTKQKTGSYPFNMEVNICFDNCFKNVNYKIPNKSSNLSSKIERYSNEELITEDDTYLDSHNLLYNVIDIPDQDSKNSGTERGTTKSNHIGKEFTNTFNRELRSNSDELLQKEKEKIESDKENKLIYKPGMYYTLREPNAFVKYLLKVMADVANFVPFTNDPKEVVKIQPPKFTFWPYGIRIEYELPLPEDMLKRNKFFEQHNPKEGSDSANNFENPDKAVTFTVHLKDPDLISKGKRWSQGMYFNYLYGYKILSNDSEREKYNLTKMEDLYDIMFLALDGDIDFHPDALITCLNRLKARKEIGICCGKIHPKGPFMNPLIHYQKFEYAIGHWFQKATEHVFGSVLCSPGCFSLMRGEALRYDISGKLDSAIDVYASRASKHGCRTTGG